MLSILNNQNVYLNECRIVPVIGIKESVMDRVVKREGMEMTVKEHLKECLGLETVERTIKSGNL